LLDPFYVLKVQVLEILDRKPPGIVTEEDDLRVQLLTDPSTDTIRSRIIEVGLLEKIRQAARLMANQISR